MLEAHNIYVHIPVCLKKCNYCSFYSVANNNPNWDEITLEIINQINYWYLNYGSFNTKTIFFGGGTPSFMPVKYLDKILNEINKKFNIMKDAEITIECNPTISNNIIHFSNIGFNRISLGVQSLKNDELKFLGRTHEVKDSLFCIDILEKNNINYSCDFMYGFYFQTEKDIKNMCKEINKLNIPHCSLYELSIEKNTFFYKQKIKQLSDDIMCIMYKIIQENLNLKRYEISNYSKFEYECKHNLNIWQGEPYIGFGKSACGRPFINGKWYEQKDYEMNLISNKTRNIEKIITGLRTVKGVYITDEIKKLINLDFIEKNNNLLYFSNGYLKATNEGFLILDNITVRVLK